VNVERWLVMDTETTGLLLPSSAPLAQQPKIIELALIELQHGMGKAEDMFWVVGEQSWLINPGEPLSDVITRITGLTDADLIDKPPFAAVLPELIDWFLGATGLVAHNLPFDLGMLTNELKRCGKEFAFPYPPSQVCTVAAYHPVFGRRAKLTEVYERVMKKPMLQKHRALDDTRALAEIIMNGEEVLQ
jgi:DNA polymerase III epsilon subunit-like protein